jgi:hypothetical protein
LEHVLEEAVEHVKTVHEMDAKAKVFFASSVHLVGLKWEVMDDDPKVLGKFVSVLTELWRSSNSMSVSVRRESILSLLRLASVSQLRSEMVKKLGGQWKECLACEIELLVDNKEEQTPHFTMLRKLLSKEGEREPICQTREDAELFAVREITSLSALELILLVTGGAFFDVVSAKLASVTKLIFEKPDPGFRLWSEGCARSVKRGLSIEDVKRCLAVWTLQPRTLKESDYRAMLNALIGTHGLWQRLLQGKEMFGHLLPDLEKLVGCFLNNTRNNVELIETCWDKLLCPLKEVFLTLLSCPNGPVVVCSWLFRGIMAGASKIPEHVSGNIADRVRAMIAAFMDALPKLPDETRRKVLQLWIECPGKDHKSVAAVGLEALRKVVSSDSVNAEVVIGSVYKQMVEMGVIPTLKYLLDHYDTSHGEKNLSSPMGLVLLLLRCRSLGNRPGSPPGVNVLPEVKQALHLVEAAVWPDFLVQLGELAVEHDALRPDLVWRVRVWSVLATTALVRMNRPSELTKSAARSPLVLFNRLPLAVLSSPGSVRPDPAVWRTVLSDAEALWRELVGASQGVEEDVSSTLSSTLEETYNKLAVQSDAFDVSLLLVSLATIVRMMCVICSFAPASLGTALSVSSGSGRASSSVVVPIGGFQYLYRPISLLSLLLNFVVSIAPEERSAVSELLDLVVNSLEALLVLPSEPRLLKQRLVDLRPLLEQWILGAPKLLGTLLAHMRSALQQDPHLKLLPSELGWLRDCLDSSKPNLHKPALAAWNDWLAQRTAGDWDDKWKSSLQRLKDSKGPDSVVLPSDLTLLSSLSAPESVTKRARASPPSPSLNLSEENLPPTQPVFSPSRAAAGGGSIVDPVVAAAAAAHASSVMLQPTQLAPEDEEEEENHERMRMNRAVAAIDAVGISQQAAVLRQMVASLPENVLADVLAGLLERLPAHVIAEKIAERLSKNK